LNKTLENTEGAITNGQSREKSLDTKKTATEDVRNPDHGFRQVNTCGGVEQTNGAPTLPLLITGSPTAMHV
jgi:hypothetical protein